MAEPASIPAGLAGSTDWFPHQADPDSGLVRLLRLDEADYRAASFLDQRAVRPGMDQRVVRFADVAAAVPAEAPRDAHWIFHIGHVGSTLVSRMLGEAPGLFALREPLVLRTLAALPPMRRAGWTGPLLALLSRRPATGARAIVKATSFVSEIADGLVAPGARALMMVATPAHYVQGILAGEASRQELAALHEARLRRLAPRLPGLDPAAVTSEARAAALAWACEATSLERAAAALPDDAVRWLDFDSFLDDPAPALAALGDVFAAGFAPGAAAAVASGPLMRRYSKAPEHAYSPALRRELLAEAGAAHRAAIADALAWLDRLAPASPLVTRALSRSR